MSEEFLEEQLRRIRELTEQMSRVAIQSQEASVELARTRQSQRANPLQEVRDVRPYSAVQGHSRDRADDRASRPRRPHTPETHRRRR
jgi:hypothetical protein